MSPTINSMTEHAPALLSVAGAALSILATIIVALLGFVVKYVLNNLESRIKELEAKLEKLTAEVSELNEHRVSAFHADRNASESISEIKTAIKDMNANMSHMKLEFATTLAEFKVAAAAVKRSITPAYPFTKVTK